MSYKTLMVHLDIGASNAARLRVAGDLAERFGASIIGIALCQPLQLLYSDGGYVAGDIVEKDRADLEAGLKEAEAQFRAALGWRAAALEWRSGIMFEALADHLAHEARRADVIITGIVASPWLDVSRSVNIGDLVMQAGRPVLIVPSLAEGVSLNRVVIGWKDTRETRRAVADAVPLLAQAAHVSLIEIAPEAELIAARARLDEVAAWLARHGIVVEALAAPSVGDDAARLNTLARDRNADVIVAGAYGHSRLREWALGGVTRDLLMRADRCALVSH